MGIYGICKVLLGQWNNEIIDKWSLVFELVVSKVDWNLIRAETEQLLTHLSHTSQPVQGRYAAVKMIAILARIKGTLIEGPIFNRAVHLSKDYEPQIRLLLSKECFVDLHKAIGTMVNRNILFEKILELFYDPDLKVKIETINVLVQIVGQLKVEAKREKIADIFVELSSNFNEEIILSLSNNLSKIILEVNPLYNSGRWAILS